MSKTRIAPSIVAEHHGLDVMEFTGNGSRREPVIRASNSVHPFVRSRKG